MKVIKLRGPEGDIKEFNIKENIIFWKVFGGIMALSGVMIMYRVPYLNGMYEKIFDMLCGTVVCYMGVYSIRELPQLKQNIITKWVLYMGYTAADEYAEKYLNDKVYKK